MDLDIRRINSHVFDVLQQYTSGVSIRKIREIVETRNVYPITNAASKIASILRAYKRRGLVRRVDNKFVLTEANPIKREWPLPPRPEYYNENDYGNTTYTPYKRRASSDDDENHENHPKRTKLKPHSKKRKQIDSIDTNDSCESDETAESDETDESAETAESDEDY